MMLMRSENPAAKALARTYPGGYDAFIAAMNQRRMIWACIKRNLVILQV